MTAGCGAPAGGFGIEGVDVAKETVIQGAVSRDGQPVVGYVRLLDSGGEFTAEVPTSPEGGFRFFSAPAPGRCVRSSPAGRSTLLSRRCSARSPRSRSRSERSLGAV